MAKPIVQKSCLDLQLALIGSELAHKISQLMDGQPELFEQAKMRRIGEIANQWHGRFSELLVAMDGGR